MDCSAKEDPYLDRTVDSSFSQLSTQALFSTSPMYRLLAQDLLPLVV
jgi:hypothetical protein